MPSGLRPSLRPPRITAKSGTAVTQGFTVAVASVAGAARRAFGRTPIPARPPHDGSRDSSRRDAPRRTRSPVQSRKLRAGRRDRSGSHTPLARVWWQHPGDYHGNLQGVGRQAGDRGVAVLDCAADGAWLSQPARRSRKSRRRQGLAGAWPPSACQSRRCSRSVSARCSRWAVDPCSSALARRRSCVRVPSVSLDRSHTARTLIVAGMGCRRPRRTRRLVGARGIFGRGP